MFNIVFMCQKLKETELMAPHGPIISSAQTVQRKQMRLIADQSQSLEFSVEHKCVSDLV